MIPRIPVLIATLGSEPQVVTATLDLLLARQADRPTAAAIQQVIVLHTTAPLPLNSERNETITPIAAAVQALREAFEAPPYAGRIRLDLRPLSDDQGELLADVETPQAARAAFYHLYHAVRQVKRAGHSVHLSIAGGRKTLAVFGMLTAQLLFDDDDRLWHLYSGGEFLASKRLHPRPGDEVHLIEIPLIQWSSVSPLLLDLAETDDPFEALQRQKALHLAERMEQARAFVRGSLTPAEERVAAELARSGLPDAELAARLSLSARTVEAHLRSIFLKAADHWDLPAVNRTQLTALLGVYYLVNEDKNLSIFPDAVQE